MKRLITTIVTKLRYTTVPYFRVGESFEYMVFDETFDDTFE